MSDPPNLDFNEWEARSERKMGEADKVMNKCLADRATLRFFINWAPGQWEKIYGKKKDKKDQR